ncbi:MULTISPECIES: helix-turn-helix domain-containing protein [unclassified Streptomyces]|uniref:helix-turn-helix domain-containing protein n=1 Tax=unclassified Streptomyces TaxID=2593676 RepID=UPI0029AE8268|nr:helix-turn-helix transcriptional regulator [Streptomyces sp. AK02-01A]MDX3851702.1 helix-turn-helix transcriptional regulator [Streptomyces sp. AK02-01A]
MVVSVNANAIFAMRRVGEELQRLRTEAGLKQEAAGEALGVSRYTVGKIERGKAFPTDEQLPTLLKLYGATPEERAGIVATIEQGRSYGRTWYERPEIQALFTGDSYRYLSLEDAAERISTQSGTYVPGLLQTREYIEAIVAFGQKHESAEHREAFVEARLRRQEVLTRRNPLTLDAVFLESALRATVGGSEAMRAQLRHLVSYANQQNITLRMIPFTAGAASISSALFTIIDFPGADNRSVVSQEQSRGETLQDDPAEVRRIRRKFTDLTDHALNAEETVRRIEEMEKELT